MSRTPKQQQEQIDAFWLWFQSNLTIIKRWYALESYEELDRLLSARVKQFDEGLTWEIGPGTSKEYSFTVSPNRSAKLLPTTDAIVARSPRLDEWEFYSAKPKKNWNFRIDVTNRKGQSVLVDAAAWKYYLTGYEGHRFFDVVLVAHNLPRLDEPASHQVAALVLEGAIGERKLIEQIGDFKIVSRVGRDTEGRLTEIGVLDEHLDSLIPG